MFKLPRFYVFKIPSDKCRLYYDHCEVIKGSYKIERFCYFIGSYIETFCKCKFKNVIVYHFDLLKTDFFNGFYCIILKVLVSLSVLFIEIKMDNKTTVVFCLFCFVLIVILDGKTSKFGFTVGKFDYFPIFSLGYHVNDYLQRPIYSVFW